VCVCACVCVCVGLHVHVGARWCLECNVLQCVALCCSGLQCVVVCCSVLQCVAVCCSVLQRVAVHYVAVPGWNTAPIKSNKSNNKLVPHDFAAAAQ